MPVTSVSSERGEGWVLITLTSSTGLNKLGVKTLVHLLDEIKSVVSENCRCLAITGTGGSFAVGADLREINGLDPSAARGFSDLGNTLFRIMESTKFITVAGIDGFCLGGGLDLALAADWRVATPRSEFGHPGADLGLITGFGGTQRLPRLLGVRKACPMFYAARRLSCHEAWEAGLVQEISSVESLTGTLMDRIRSFAGLSPEWIRRIKGRFRNHSDGWLGTGRINVTFG